MSTGADPTDGMVLRDCRVTNAVRCVPPANLPTASRRFVRVATLIWRKNWLVTPLRLRLVLFALGGVSDKAVLQARGSAGERLRRSSRPRCMSWRIDCNWWTATMYPG